MEPARARGRLRVDGSKEAAMKSRLAVLGLTAALLSLGAVPAFGQAVEPVPPDKVIGLYVSEVVLRAGGKAVEAAPASETVTAKLTVANQGKEDAKNARLKVGAAPDGVKIVDGTASLGDIPAGGTATGTVSFEIAADTCPDGLGIDATIDSSLGESPASFGVPTDCPGPRLYTESVRYTGGDGDQIPEPGEDLKMFVTLRNSGHDPATGVRATLSIDSANFKDVRVTDASANWPDIAGGDAAESTSAFGISISDTAKREVSCGGMTVDPGVRPSGAADEPVSSDGSAGASGSGGSGTATLVAGTASAAPGAGSEPGSAPPSDGTTPPDGTGTIEPAPAPAEPTPTDQDPVAFEGALKIEASGKTFDMYAGSTVVCAYSSGMKGGGAVPPGAMEKGARDLASASTGAKTPAGRTGPIAVAAVLLAAVASVAGRYRYGRLATQKTTSGA
jgi:hypothetical protein